VPHRAFVIRPGRPFVQTGREVAKFAWRGFEISFGSGGPRPGSLEEIRALTGSDFAGIKTRNVIYELLSRRDESDNETYLIIPKLGQCGSLKALKSEAYRFANQ
jgi:hypothetical protein